MDTGRVCKKASDKKIVELFKNDKLSDEQKKERNKKFWAIMKEENAKMKEIFNAEQYQKYLNFPVTHPTPPAKKP